MSGGADRDTALLQFISFTSSDDVEVATKYLEACGWNVQTAVERYFSTNGDVSQLAPPSSAPPSRPAPPAASPLSGMFGGMLPFGTGGFGGMGGGSGGAGTTGPASDPHNGVRAPDDAVTSQMLPSNFSIFGNGRRRGSRDPLRNFGDEWAEAPQNQRQYRSSMERKKAETHREKLAQMFRAPEYCCQGSLDEACAVGKKQNMWVVVNLQDTEEFSSHMLNRDCWKNEELAEFVQANFILWQKEKNQEDGRRFKTYYNVAKLPTIYILDPRTKRHETTISIPNKPTADYLLAQLMEFIGSHEPPMSANPTPALSTSTSISLPEPTTTSEAMDEDDDADLMAAIAMSMADTQTESEQQPEPEPVPQVVVPPEPADGDPNAVEIRVTMPGGKMIQRKFLRSHTVQTLYDWITAEFQPTTESILLFVPMPRQNLTDKTKTLQQMGLNRARIVCSFDD